MTSPQSTNNTSPAGRKPRAKLKRAYIRTGYASHPDIIALTAHFGIQGKCASYDINLVMSAASDGIIDRQTLLYTAKLNEVSEPEKYLQFCLERKIFIEIEGGYSNTIVLKDQESYAETLRRDKERNGKKTGNEREKDRLLDIDIDHVSEFDLKDLKKNGHPENLKIPISNLDTPEVRKALALWEKHLAKLKKPLNEISLQAVLAQYSGRPGDLVDAIYHTTGNNWRTLIPKPSTEPQSTNQARAGPLKPSQNLVNQMVSQKAVDEILERHGENVNSGNGQNTTKRISQVPKPNSKSSSD